LVLSIVMLAFLHYRHRANVARLRAGTEPRIGRRA
jgi:glycerol-3-phosphate acyltransferase PlsY